MSKYNKEKVSNLKSMPLSIWWWNFGKKTKSFEGTLEEYFNKHEVLYSVSVLNDESFDRIKFKCRFNIGSLSFKFEGYDLEDMARMVLNIHLSYMGDKAKYVLGNREWSNNYHR